MSTWTLGQNPYKFVDNCFTKACAKTEDPALLTILLSELET